MSLSFMAFKKIPNGMNKWLRFFPLLFLPFLACSTYYEVAFDHFDRATKAYKNGQLGQTVREYDQALSTFKEANPQLLDQLLTAAIYHQIYLMNPLVFWEKLDKSFRDQCPAISKIISGQPTTKSPDLLLLAFRAIIVAEEMSKENVLPKHEEWLLIEKNIIIGDLLMREANSEEEAVIKEVISDSVPDEFINRLKKLSYYELALTFYLDAWVKTINFIYRYPALNLQWLTELSQKRLKEVCWALVSITTSLSSQNRNEEFRNIFRQKSQQYLDSIKQIEITSLPLPADVIASEEKLIDLTGLKQEKNYLDLDATYHFNEARFKISTAMEEIIAKKSISLPYFLDALKHIALVRILTKQNTLPYQESVFFLNEDIYLHLYRLSD